MPISSHVKQTFYEDRAELLYGNAIAGFIATLSAAILLVFGFYNIEVQTEKYLWLGGLCLVILARFLDYRYWLKLNKSKDYKGKNAVNRFVFGTLITGIIWCLYCFCFVQYASITELACIIIILSAFAGGAATVLAAHKVAAMSYALIMLGPASLILLLSSEEYKVTLGLMGVVFGGVMMFAAKKSADFTSNAIRLKNENAELVNKMEHKVAQRTEEIYQLSNLDPLTGLFNRSAFMMHLESKLEESKQDQSSIALLFIDLDGFKKINDTLGHETGDKILKQTAERLERFRDDKHLLCRWGGDEFLIAVVGATQDSAVNYAQEVIKNISQSYQFENNILSIGATIGVALSPKHSQEGHELIQLADTAMYDQKKTNSGSVGLFNTEIGLRIFRENQLKMGLARALELKQLRLVYQPIVTSDTHEIIAFEALSRWNFNGENIPPEEFIAIAEQHGLINDIGTWVLQQSCLAAVGWLVLNKDIQPSVSVNVSVLQLHNSKFIHIVESALAASQLPAEKLTIEITESILSHQKETIFMCIKKLQSMGVKVSIDDFGTKYSSLSVIQDLAANTIKIDRSFVNMLESSGKAIIEAVKLMAVKLDYDVIAEGVETQEQAEQLSALGVEMLQGYYFSKPIELNKIEDYFQQQTN